MTEIVLALNAGSSTLKYALYRVGEDREQQLARATLKAGSEDSPALLHLLLNQLSQQHLPTPSIIGHRVVHGGASYAAPSVVDESVLVQLEKLIPLAPLHLPPALSLVRAALERCPNVQQVACFDTAFHHTLPDVARRLPLPAELEASGIHRYGFHGLSYEYVLSALGAPPPERLVVAHLGSGASLAAILQGRSIDTSMGLTPTGGIPMGTRPGDLDPGVLVYLLRERGYSIAQLEHLLNHEAGLKGLAGSAEVSELLTRARADDTTALSALELFGYAIKKQIGAYFAALGGLDCLVFTGGVGENAPLVRELACRGLQQLGIELDPLLNAQNAPFISQSTSRCSVRIIATNEDLVIARAAYALRPSRRD